MLTQYCYPFLDVLVYPLLYLPRSISLSVVSVVIGLIMLIAYRYTSDQWAMAFYKDRIKSAQLDFIRGNDRWDNFLTISRLNLKLFSSAFVPAIVCIVLLLIFIPWVGNRFGYRPVQPMEPVELTVRSNSEWHLSARPPHLLRYEPDTGPFQAGQRTMRLLVEEPIDPLLRIGTDKGGGTRITLRVQPTTEPIWPTIQSPQWYYPLVNPAEQVIPPSSSIQSIKVHYTEVLAFLSFTVPYSSRVPGWMSWFFLVSFTSGIWAKLHWEIE